MLKILKKIINSNFFFRSLIITVLKKIPTLVIKDQDGDFIITTKKLKIVSSSPFAGINEQDMDLFTYAYKCKKGDNIIICGVDEGLELAHFCKACAPGKVIAIECTPSCVRKLKKLRDLNNFSNLEIIGCAAGEKRGELFLKEGPTSHTNQVSSSEDKESTKILTLPLTEICSELGFFDIDYLKINTEGSELNVLNGISTEINIKNICISCHDFIDPSMRTYDDVKEWLKNYGYSFTRKEMDPRRFWDNYYLFAYKK